MSKSFKEFKKDKVYFCQVCKKNHRINTRIGRRHYFQDFWLKEVNSNIEGILDKAIDDRDFRSLLLKNPERAIEETNLEINKFDAKRLKLFFSIFDITKISEKDKIREAYNKYCLSNATAGVRG